MTKEDPEMRAFLDRIKRKESPIPHDQRTTQLKQAFTDEKRKDSKTYQVDCFVGTDLSKGPRKEFSDYAECKAYTDKDRMLFIKSTKGVLHDQTFCKVVTGSNI